MNITMADFYGILFVLAIVLFVYFLWAMLRERSEWSDWIPIVANGVPGFVHSKFSEGISDDMMRTNPRISIRTDQFVPLKEFLGKGCKPVNLEEWGKLYAKRKPYKWHLSESSGQY
ncbi:MAG: hypothetical protein A2Y67_00735 [Candidatus Buchananbacteria bacterium RBG_13_39_9]|uniref:Uncharacterized protein n=1 Tax=Candidatus Buchananbacteria bacterium RBG_13_39_9 TaxID=1797531 RepID=A0A1G1XMD2_9BACT|nr:MAG: hypothetical protein A2Y67_00735 [Candidatus Buchananbacteria bacterium RBG_13_39_9]